ncbi:regulator of chromosome condensation 1/beta-lactamase-inhibitor protein II [Baffinella frigidus]|nr:regulator of chromosome condensation 1/beta-lactamase-inhibitor protein II [Cryptophyta sp. CCMP2293]
MRGLVSFGLSFVRWRAGGNRLQRQSRAGAEECSAQDGGSLTCWGKNSQGQLGVGDTDNNLSPVAVVGLGGTAVAVAVGYGHSCAILDGGAVKCWGSNFNGKLGSGTSGDKHTPVVVAMGGAAVALAVGVSHACAILDGGSLKCWGSNTQGELGDSTTTDSTTPVDVDLGGTAVAVAVGSLHSCAILDGGAVKCWGKNTEGQLGVGDTTDRLSPVDPFVLWDRVSSRVDCDACTLPPDLCHQGCG